MLEPSEPNDHGSPRQGKFAPLGPRPQHHRNLTTELDIPGALTYTSDVETKIDIAAAIQHNYLLKGLTKEQVGEIALLARAGTFEGGDTILRQFAKDSDIMILLEGKARVNTFSGELIAEAGPGSVIGEVSLIDDKPRSATVVAVGHCVVARIPSTELWTLLDREPEIAKVLLLNLGRILCARLRAANVQLDLVVGKN